MSERGPSMRRAAPTRTIALLVLFCTALTTLGAVDSAPAGIEMQAQPAQVAIGEELAVEIRYRYPADWTPLGEPDPSKAFAGETVLAMPPPVHELIDGVQHHVWRLRLRAEASDGAGAWSLPRPHLTLRDRDGAEQQLTANETIVQVGLGSADAALPAPRPLQQARSAPLLPWWAWIVGGLVLLTVAVLLARLLRRDTTGAPADPMAQLARELDAARACENGKQGGAQLSRALRRYCGTRWAFDGVGATSDELVRHLDASVPSTELYQLRRMLRQLEELRWAPVELQVATLQPLIDAARDWAQAQEERLRAEAEAAAERDAREHAA